MPRNTDPFSQTRGTRGSVPVESAEPAFQGSAGTVDAMDGFLFRPLSPTALTRQAGSTGTGSPKKSKDRSSGHALKSELKDEVRDIRHEIPLTELATSFEQKTIILPDGSEETSIGIKKATLLESAAKLGPLLARAPFAVGAGTHANGSSELAADAPLIESLGLWGSAAAVASTTVLIQETVLGASSIERLIAKLPDLTKRSLLNRKTGTAFTLLVLTLPVVGGEYAAWLDLPSFIRREEAEGHIDYSFLLYQEDKYGPEVQLLLASFEHEITASDYRLLSSVCGLGAAIDADANERLNLDLDLNGDAADPSSDFDPEELVGHFEELGPGDVPLLKSMVRALVAAHMRDARVDLFSADSETGYLAFDSLLSWLWYDYSKNLDIARIRYCEQCGRPFAIAKHRGPDKRFCSIECKNNARNASKSDRNNRVREAFRERNASVSELARTEFVKEGQTAGEARVRSCLSSWPTLKHDLDEDIARYGWDESPLLKRCRREKLDLTKLLPARRQAELKRMAEQKRKGK